MLRKFDIKKNLFALDFVEIKALKYFLNIRLRFNEGKVKFLKRHEKAFLYFIDMMFQKLAKNNSSLSKDQINVFLKQMFTLGLIKSHQNIVTTSFLPFLFTEVFSKSLLMHFYPKIRGKKLNSLYNLDLEKDDIYKGRVKKRRRFKISRNFLKKLQKSQINYSLLDKAPLLNNQLKSFTDDKKGRGNYVKGFSLLCFLNILCLQREIIISSLLNNNTKRIFFQTNNFKKSLIKFQETMNREKVNTIEFFENIEKNEEVVYNEIICDRALFLSNKNFKERYAAYTGKFHVQIKVTMERLNTKLGEYVFTKRTGGHIHTMGGSKKKVKLLKKKK
jgi:ribosomal protein S19